MRGSARLGEDADSAWAYEQAHDDENDAPQNLAAKQRHDSGDHEYHRENPQQKLHARGLPRPVPAKHRLVARLRCSSVTIVDLSVGFTPSCDGWLTHGVSAVDRPSHSGKVRVR